MSIYSLIRGVFSISTRTLLRARFEGLENIPDSGACILAANHISFWDPVLIVGAVKNRELTFLARSSLFHKPIVRFLLKKTHSVPVERNGSDLSAIRAALGALKNGDALTIYPQGTRCPDREPHDTPFLDGAAYLALYSAAAVVPVGIYTKNYRIRWFRRVRVVFGKAMQTPVLSSAERKEELKPYSERIKREILTLCDQARDRES